MYNKVGKVFLIIGALCLVFILAIGFKKDNKDTDEVTAQGNAIETRSDIKEQGNNSSKVTKGNNGLEQGNENNNDDDTVIIDEEGKQIVTNPDDIHVLVNKQRNLPSDYAPDDLIEPNIKFSFTQKAEKRYMREEAAYALERLVGQAEQEGIEIVGVSGYRSYKRQQAIFDYNVKKRGYEAANKISAKPGQSEHQTGLSIDVSCAEINYKLQEKLGELQEGIWLQENAHKFGFIIRYHLGKDDITGYQYEPWHLRYLGEDIAKDVYEKGLTYEEYFEQYMLER